MRTLAGRVFSAVTTVPFSISSPMGPRCTIASAFVLALLRRRAVRRAGSFFPGLCLRAGLHFHHRDALLDRTYQRAQVATDALRLIDTRNPGERRCAVTVGRRCVRVQLWNWRDRDAGAGSSFDGGWLDVELDMPVHRPRHAIEMDALVRTIPA